MATWFRRRLASVNWLGLATIFAILVVWQLLVSTKIVNYAALPGPIDVWNGFTYLLGPYGGLGSALGHTLHCVLIAWLIAVGAGTLVGMLMALNSTVAEWAGATVDLLRSLPVIALIPVAILIWGTGSKTEIILGAYAGLWPMLINTTGGARSIPPALQDVARSMRLSRAATVRKVILPATATSILVGARLALSTTLVVCVVSEMLGLQSGIGNQLLVEQFEQSRAWAYVIVIGVLGILLNFVLVRLVRLLVPGISAASERSIA